MRTAQMRDQAERDMFSGVNERDDSGNGEECGASGQMGRLTGTAKERPYEEPAHVRRAVSFASINQETNRSCHFFFATCSLSPILAYDQLEVDNWIVTPISPSVPTSRSSPSSGDRPGRVCGQRAASPPINYVTNYVVVPHSSQTRFFIISHAPSGC